MRTSCPKCGTMNRVTYPDGFYFNEAAYECSNCGLKERSTDLDTESALMNLMEMLSEIKQIGIEKDHLLNSKDRTYG